MGTSVRQGLIRAAVGAVDKALLLAMRARTASERAHHEALSVADRLALFDAVAAEYRAPMTHHAPEHESEAFDRQWLFPQPRLACMEAREVGSLPRSAERAETNAICIQELSWDSAFCPISMHVASKYGSRVDNRMARARLFTPERPTPSSRAAVIVLHGYMGGQWLVEQSQWPIRRLVRAGLDVALCVLPFHGVRGESAHRGAPPFPSADPRMTIEACRQTVSDVRSLATWLRARGAVSVGVMGLSLGGYLAALVATVARDVDFVCPIVPLASFAAFADEQGRLGQGVERSVQIASMERAYASVSPLMRPLQINPKRALVVVADQDLITPASHGKRMAERFRCAMLTLPGGHVLAWERENIWHHLIAMLEREQLLDPALARLSSARGAPP